MRRGPGQEHLYLLEVKGKRVRNSEVALLVVWEMSVSFFGTVQVWDLGGDLGTGVGRRVRGMGQSR